jgi:ketosteroid isomerase-like protein
LVLTIDCPVAGPSDAGEHWPGGDRENFHEDFLPRFIDAQRAFHAGDPEPNIALWSTAEPVTLFAVRGKRKRGTGDVTAAFREVAAWFSNLESYEWESVAEVSVEEFAYTVCLERYTASVNGGPPETVEYRSTHIFRLEAGAWRAVHRHADRQPASE